MRRRVAAVLTAAALLVVAVAPIASASQDRLYCESGRALWLLRNPEAGPADQDVSPVGTVFGEAGRPNDRFSRGPLVQQSAHGVAGVAYYTASGPDGQVLWANDTLGGPVYVDDGVCIEPEPDQPPIRVIVRSERRPVPIGDPIDVGRCPGCLQPPT